MSRVMAEGGALQQSRTHAMMQKMDYRFELSTVNVADNLLHVDRNANKKTVIFNRIPTVTRQDLNSLQNSLPNISKITNINKKVFE